MLNPPMNSIPVSEMGLPQWFALAVKPRFDKAVARTLDTKGFETFLPLYKKRHNYGARCKEFELPLFPGYVFCRFNALMRLPIVTTPGVTHILGDRKQAGSSFRNGNRFFADSHQGTISAAALSISSGRPKGTHRRRRVGGCRWNYCKH